MSQTKIRLTRPELYEKAWATPMRNTRLGLPVIGLRTADAL